MGADFAQRQRRRAKKLERLRRRQAERRKSSGFALEPLGPSIELDPRDASPRLSSRPKLSMILLELVQPFLHPTERSLKEMRTGIALASAVWNATILEQQGEDAWPQLTDSLRVGPAEDDAALLQIASAMRDMKRRCHPSDLRAVLRWTVTERGDTFDVQVMSAHTEEDGPLGRVREA